ncbi:hypothetical protein DTO96_100134 [Ephemeroptericola cinctiostellae]|uniref:Uncharacterized protein n=1 Tax=Ephemeroptericola cinctiostellae TaxID=2268024 RepID=A0A345D7T9_9BURK|nr:hypothetical protein DTO96_100134 [Ephemeroptericola cinctiostellae]
MNINSPVVKRIFANKSHIFYFLMDKLDSAQQKSDKLGIFHPEVGIFIFLDGF